MHAVAGKHGVAPAVPPAQNDPIGHTAHAVALAPDDNVPGAQGTATATPPAHEKPTGQGVIALAADVEPTGQYDPGGDAQGVQAKAPAPENVPAGQTVAFMDEGGQNEPAGQRTGVPETQ